MLNVDVQVLTAIKHASGSVMFQLRELQSRPCPCSSPCRGSLMRAGFFVLWAMCLHVSSSSPLRKQIDRETDTWQQKYTLLPIKHFVSSGPASFCCFGSNFQLPLICPALSIANWFFFLSADHDNFARQHLPRAYVALGAKETIYHLTPRHWQ